MGEIPDGTLKGDENPTGLHRKAKAKPFLRYKVLLNETAEKELQRLEFFYLCKSWSSDTSGLSDDVLLQFAPSIKPSRKDDARCRWKWQEGWWQITGLFETLLICWDFHILPLTRFKDEHLKKRNHSAAAAWTESVNDVWGELADQFEIKKTPTRTKKKTTAALITTTKVWRITSLNKTGARPRRVKLLSTKN